MESNELSEHMFHGMGILTTPKIGIERGRQFSVATFQDHQSAVNSVAHNSNKTGNFFEENEHGRKLSYVEENLNFPKTYSFENPQRKFSF